MSTHLAIILTFPLLLALSGAYDLVTMTIPNWLALALTGCFVALAALSGMPATAWTAHVACGGVVLVAGFACFYGGFIGGGDAKLLAASALWLGWERLPIFLAATGFFCSALAVGLKTLQRAEAGGAWASPPWMRGVHDPAGRMPCGVAIAAAGMLVYPHAALVAG